MLEAIKEFSRFAQDYESYNVIQKKVASTLISLLPLSDYETIIDIGCGEGEVYRNLKSHKVSFQKFIALDSSEEMLTLHPSKKNIQKIKADFNTVEAFENFSLQDSSLVLSSSSLQWSKDLDLTLAALAQKSSKGFFAIFTANTFKTVHKVAGLTSPIYTQEQIEEAIKKYYHASFILKTYTLHFESTRNMFRYIKKSGVSGGNKQLSYSKMKHLMDRYPLDYLEFEVLFVKAEPLQN